MTSVAEDEVLRILVLVRNFAPGWKQVSEGGWNVAAVVHHAYDLIDRTVGTVGGGRIGQELMKRLKVSNPYVHVYGREIFLSLICNVET